MVASAPLGMTTRRGFAAGLGALTLLRPWRGAAEARDGGRGVLAYVGDYTPDAEGIYLCRLDRVQGTLVPLKTFRDIANPSWLATDAAGRRLYAVNEVKTYHGAAGASVSAFAIEPATGELTLLNSVSSHGLEPPHLSVHPSGRWVLVANYRNGTIAVLPVQADGSLGEAVDVQQNSGPGGPPIPADGPPGYFPSGDSDGHPHAHMIAADPTGRFVLVDDLGLDRLYVWRFDVATGRLTPNDPAFVATSAGGGPRHFVFHPNGRVLYNLLEEASRLVAYRWDSGSGHLSEIGSASTLPAGFAGSNLASEVVVSPDGQHVYAANRLHNSVAIFHVESDGRLQPRGHEWVRGDYPRHITLDPSGGFLFCCNQRSDDITAFRVNRVSGALTSTGRYTPVGSPTNLTFLG